MVRMERDPLATLILQQVFVFCKGFWVECVKNAETAYEKKLEKNCEIACK